MCRSAAIRKWPANSTSRWTRSGPGSWRRACAWKHATCSSIPRMWRLPTIATARLKPIWTSGVLSATGAKSAPDFIAPTARYGCAWAIPRSWTSSTTRASCSSNSATTSSTICISRAMGSNSLFSGTQIETIWAPAGSVVSGTIKATTVPELFSLGGFFNLSGLAPASLFGQNYAITRAIYFRKIGRGGEGFFEFPAYIGASLELGDTWQQRGNASFGSARKDGSIFLAFDTFLGPVYLGSGYDTAGHSAYYLFLGRTF